MIRLYVRSLAFWTVEIATSLATVARDCWRGPTPTPEAEAEAIERHPAGKAIPPLVPKPIDAEAAYELAVHDAVLHLARWHGLAPIPVDVAAEVIALEGLLMAPAAEGVDD